MKRLVPTIVLVLLCIGGFWYASSKDFFREKTPEAPALVTVKKEEVAGYTIKNEGKDIELQQKDGVWTMVKPSALPLNQQAPGGWIDAFNGVKKDKIVDANPTDLAPFGLAQPTREFTLRLASGAEHKLLIGDPVAVQGFYYAKAGNAPDVFQIPESSVTALSKQETDFVETRPVQTAYEQIRAVTVNWKGSVWTLSKAEPDKQSFEAKWKLGTADVAGVDASGYLDKAAFLTAANVPKSAADVKGLDRPELKLEIKTADASGKEAADVYAGKAEGDVVWIAKQGGAWAYPVPAASVQELADKFREPPKATAAPAPAPAEQPAAPQTK